MELSKECQPCANFKSHSDEPGDFGMYNYHQCMVCLTGMTRFCHNCCQDHHVHGFNTCKPSEYCKYNSPLCAVRWIEYNSQIAGIPVGEFI